jgi:hypothetical protein
MKNLPIIHIFAALGYSVLGEIPEGLSNASACPWTLRLIHILIALPEVRAY